MSDDLDTLLRDGERWFNRDPAGLEEAKSLREKAHSRGLAPYLHLDDSRGLGVLLPAPMSDDLEKLVSQGEVWFGGRDENVNAADAQRLTREAHLWKLPARRDYHSDLGFYVELAGGSSAYNPSSCDFWTSTDQGSCRYCAGTNPECSATWKKLPE
jgi:hypothetical protein